MWQSNNFVITQPELFKSVTMKEGPGQVGYLVAVQVENLQSAFVSKDLWRHVVETAMPVVEFLDFIIGRF